MAKSIDVTIAAPMNAGAVRMRLRDPEALRAIALAAGAVDATATTEGNVTTIVRTMSVPEAARLMVKAETINIVETRTWGSVGADVQMHVEGMAVTMRGRLELKETGEHALVHATGNIEAKLGFMGPLVEAMLRERMIEAIRAEVEALR